MERFFWSDSKLVATTGQVSLDVLKRYVDSQGEGIEENKTTTEAPDFRLGSLTVHFIAMAYDSGFFENFV